MSTPEYIKCPGSDPVSKALPEFYVCPECQTEFEIWTDESGGKCPSCNSYFKKQQVRDSSGALSAALKKKSSKLNDLIQKAAEFGATEAAVIPAKKIRIDDRLADKCKEPRCENYGLSRSCPPYVSGPSHFRKLLETYQQAVFFRIDVPAEILFSGERREIFRLLHEITAGIEKEAIKMGYPDAQGYAGGSCKKIFCHDQPECRVISEKGKCRHPQSARPSMSGFGVDVSKLFEAAGWTMSIAAKDAGGNKMSNVCALVLIS